MLHYVAQIGKAEARFASWRASMIGVIGPRLLLCRASGWLQRVGLGWILGCLKPMSISRVYSRFGN